MPSDARTIVRGVLPRNMADEVWSAGYDRVLPISFSRFELSAVLPAVLYMFRFGQRRGRGAFLSTFVSEAGTRRERKRRATVERVAESLASRSDLLGFSGPVEKAILGDLLLCFGLENAKHDLGRDKQIQRVAPAHYLASWVDLPESVTDLRYVPEMIVAMLANEGGDHVEQSDGNENTWFAVARGFEDNVLLRAFGRGMSYEGQQPNYSSDRFDEATAVGLDQLLMIRLAQELGAAPDRPRGNETARISNQRPIAEKAAVEFSEDIRRFVRGYAGSTPRYAFIDMLESCVSTGMTAVLFSVMEMLFAWLRTGAVPEKHVQRPASILVDCSSGVDIRLRGLAEQSLDDVMRRVERVPVVLMVLRLLDYAARNNRRVKREQVETRPYATEWLNLLGALLHGRHAEAAFIHQQMDDHADRLADALEGEYPAEAKVLRSEESEANAVRRLAAGLTPLLGSTTSGNLIGMVESTLQVGRPNGLAQKRATTRGANPARFGRRRRDVRSLVLTDSVLDYLTHVQLLRNTKGSRLETRRLSLPQFLDKTRRRYGFHVDVAPEGMTVSNELLQANRRILERRLRDLGLLVGVNDAERMKRVRGRFRPVAGD